MVTEPLPPARAARPAAKTTRPSPDASPDDYFRPTPLFILTIGLVGLFAFVQVYSVQSILPQLQHDLQASVVQVGNSVGVTVLAVALMSPFVGMLSDAVGRKWLIVGSVFALAIPTALITQVDTIHGLLVLRFLQGLAVPGVSVVAIAYVGEESRGAPMMRIMAIYVTGSVLGGFLGRFLMGHLTEFMAWRSAFGVMAALNLAGAVVVWRGLPASRHFVANPNVATSLAMAGRLLCNPFLLAACAVGFTVLFALVGLFTFVNLHLAAAPYFFSPGELANVFAVYLLGVVVTPLSGRMISRLGARRTVLIAVATSACGLLLTLVQPAWGIVVALALAAGGVFFTQSAVMSFLAYRITQGRSLASGLYYTAYYCGGFSGAWVGGIAYTLGGWTATVAVLAVFQALGWAIAWRFMPRTAPASRG